MKNTPKYKTKWDLTLFYKNLKDPQIEKDVVAIEKACVAFEKKYKDLDYVSTPEKLAKAMRDSVKLTESMMGYKPLVYLISITDTDSENSEARAMFSKYESRLTLAGNRVTFFDLKIANIPKSEQKKFLNYPGLKDFRFALEKTFENAKYNLSEKEEKIINLFSSTSFSMWVEAQEKILSEKTLVFKGKNMTVHEAVEILPDLPSREDRKDLHKKVIELLKTNAPIAEAELNAVYNYKKVLDDLRGHKKPYSSSLLAFDSDEKTIELLVKLVTKHFSISRRFYKLHAKILGFKKIPYSDKNVKIGEIKKKFDLDSSISIVGEAIGKVDPKYKELLLRYFAKGQIDVYPKKGKKGGAYCRETAMLPIMLLLNHVDSIKSLETLAHEMGHAIHTELANTQPLQYRPYSTAVAEVASTFFEQVALADVEQYLSDDEKVVLLHSQLMGDMTSIFQQIAGFNIELDLHNQVRAKGRITEKETAQTVRKHLSSYFGDAVEMLDDDGYFFVRWMHLRMFFYMYSYAYGQLISRALFENWKKDKGYAKKIEEFLSYGGSMTPENIFKKVGIDTSNPKFFESGLKSIEKDIDRLEKLVSKKK